jgi:hypothetical protein
MNIEQILVVLGKASTDIDTVSKEQLLDAACDALAISTYTKKKCAEQVAESKRAVADMAEALIRHGQPRYTY